MKIQNLTWMTRARSLEAVITPVFYWAEHGWLNRLKLHIASP